MRLRPIFELIVIAEIDFTQPVHLGRTLVIIGPARESLLRRAAITTAGIIDKSIARQRRCRRPEPQAPYVGARRSVLGAGHRRTEEERYHSDRLDQRCAPFETPPAAAPQSVGIGCAFFADWRG